MKPEQPFLSCRSAVSSLVLTAVVSIFSSSALSAPTFSQMLEGSAAYCSFKGSQALDEANNSLKQHGEASAKYKAVVATASRVSSNCIDTEAPKLKPLLKQEVEARPALAVAIKDAYASWLDYMEWLRTPRPSGADSFEKYTFESKMNLLKAEMNSL